MRIPEVPILHVGGYYDQEDMNGPQLMYGHMEKTDAKNRNYIVLGPWFHGQWSGGNADSLGKISFGSNTGENFRALQKKWFDYWLKGVGDGKFDEATIFKQVKSMENIYCGPQKLYKKFICRGRNKAGFSKPAANG